MNFAAFKALAMNEVRLRLRRTSTLVALLAVSIISWAMMGDPASGDAVIVINNTRVLYTSNVIAIGSASLACILFGLGGFYLVRGRVAEDVRSGIGSVIGATPVGNALFLVSRWAGGVAYLGALMVAFMCTMLALHLVRGDGPIALLVYLQIYALLLLPMLFFTVSCAILFDSVASLMGKAGDVLYFFVWCFQLSAAIAVTAGVSRHVPLVTMFDFSGIGAAMLLIRQGFDTTNISLGGGSFDAALAPLTLPHSLWSARLVAMRCASGALALLPLLPAVLLFHRFSPDLVKISSAAKRRAPLDVLDGMLRPLAKTVQPLFRLAARLPGMAGQVLADIALTFVTSPSALVAVLGITLAAMVVPAKALGPLLMFSAARWGILVCNLSTRDMEADTQEMTGAVKGGVIRRFVRQYAATALLGFMFMGMVALRFSLTQPVRALALVAGVLCLSALASLFGRCAGTSRLFLALFLFGLYVAVNVVTVPMIDAFGFNGVANAHSALAYLAVGALALVGGYWWNRRAA
ncbi:hypothetical protein [Massilia sp. TSP1-1-2]|uniref:hypothetical protein n=1 Tax=Massilia sp. TSP1-1-2 TaxID=2804649 RepID=UPI003CF3DE0A